MSADSTAPAKLMPCVLRFLRDLTAYAGRKGAAAAVFVALGALLEGLGLMLIVPLLGVVTGTVPGRLHRLADGVFALFGIATPFGRLLMMMAIFVLLMLLRAVVVSRRGILLAELRIGFVESRRFCVTERLAAARWDQVVRLRHARITHLMSGDIQRIGVAANALLQGLAAVAMLAAQGVLAFLLNPLLALLALALAAASFLALIPMLRRARLLGGYVTNANLALLDGTAQFLGGLKTAVSQNLQGSYVAEFHRTLQGLTDRQIEFIRRQTGSQIGLTTMSALVGAGLVLAGFGIFHTSPPVLIALLVIVARMSGPAVQVQQNAQQLAHALPAYEKVRELIGELSAAKETPAGNTVPPEGAVVFDAVCFAHGEDGEAPRGVYNLNLSIAPGEFLGIGGPSGAGKTTFADLLAGLYFPQAGRITVGGRKLDETVLAGWRNSISYVSQDPFLFHDTVRRNLAWANPAASEAEMWQAIELAGAGFVRRMEHGLDTVAGERGTLMSGGERQRIALARAVLRNPRLLILDEASNAVDVAGEREILERLRTLSPRPAIVMIAHRPESLQFCDRTLTLENGRLCGGERGKP